SVSIVMRRTFCCAMGRRSAWPLRPCRRYTTDAIAIAEAMPIAAPVSRRFVGPTPDAAAFRFGPDVEPGPDGGPGGSVLRGVRAGPRGLDERASRFRADGIGLLRVAEHGPQPRGQGVALWRRRHA